MPTRFPISPLVCLFVICGATPTVSGAGRVVAGTVVDQSGRIVPRAYVRVLDVSGRLDRGAFADEAGRFELGATDGADCRVEATLAGFQPAVVPCSPAGAGPLRVVLGVAPIQETTIVTATRTEAPTSQVGASATVFTGEDLDRRQQPLVADLLTATPGAMLVRNGAPGTLTSLFVRGGESDYNKVLLDGVPLNEPGGTFYLSNLTTENLERIEIVRGAYSSLFGSSDGQRLKVHEARDGSGSPCLGQRWWTYDTLHVPPVPGAAGPRFSLGVAQ